MRLQALPNAITVLRLALVPAMLALAAAGAAPRTILLLMGCCFLTDLVDGLLARWLRATSPFGARLDSIADFVFYLSIPIAGWLVWPELVQREASWFGAAIAAIVVPAGIAYAKFRTTSGYHPWLAKLGAAIMGAGLLVLFAVDYSTVFHLAVIIAALAAVEEIAITLLLDAPSEDVRSLWHVFTRRRHGARLKPR